MKAQKTESKERDSVKEEGSEMGKEKGVSEKKGSAWVDSEVKM